MLTNCQGNVKEHQIVTPTFKGKVEGCWATPKEPTMLGRC
jgi:hypothetical protein